MPPFWPRPWPSGHLLVAGTACAVLTSGLTLTELTRWQVSLYYSPLTSEETEAQRGQRTQQRHPASQSLELRLEIKSLTLCVSHPHLPLVLTFSDTVSPDRYRPTRASRVDGKSFLGMVA